MARTESANNINKRRKYNMILESKKCQPKIAIPLSQQLKRFQSTLKPTT